eukprot:GILI01045497.1.p1 GENE.GILI01045497.1~~GILI01045497.1.p1  ORF type:complete len:109 (+),score=21.34 GILI01045497.1:110-436(+)
MYDALCVKVASLPLHTQVYCGHEYTVGNLLFARDVEPENQSVIHKLQWAQQQRAQGLPTIPSTVAEELAINPFMRVHDPAVQQFTGKSDPIEVMAAVREAKNTWKPRL